jgi:hypothetical protein
LSAVLRAAAVVGEHTAARERAGRARAVRHRVRTRRIRWRKDGRVVDTALDYSHQDRRAYPNYGPIIFRRETRKSLMRNAARYRSKAHRPVAGDKASQRETQAARAHVLLRGLRGRVRRSRRPY